MVAVRDGGSISEFAVVTTVKEAAVTMVMMVVRMITNYITRSCRN
jgi:hypothetical protein